MTIHRMNIERNTHLIHSGVVFQFSRNDIENSFCGDEIGPKPEESDPAEGQYSPAGRFLVRGITL